MRFDSEGGMALLSGMVRIPIEDGSHHDLLIRGMFTFRAVSQPSRHVPVLRQVLSRILKQDHARPGSWRYKGMANIFDTLPSTPILNTGLRVTNDVNSLLLGDNQEQANTYPSTYDVLGRDFFISASYRF